MIIVKSQQMVGITHSSIIIGSVPLAPEEKEECLFPGKVGIIKDSQKKMT